MATKQQAEPEQDPIEAMRQRATVPSDPEGETWEPKAAGDEVYGQIIDLRVVETKQNGPKPLMIVTTTEGNKAIWLGGVCLSRFMKDSNPSIGDYVYLRFEGAVKLNNGRTMNQYAVALEEGDGPRSNVLTPKPTGNSKEADFDPFA